MKKLIATLAGLTCALAITVHADDATGKSTSPTDAKAVKKEMITKYDTNKDGKLDKEERAKMTAEDQKKWSDAGLGKKHPKKSDKQSQ
jgi:hypothetical protein